VRQQTELQQKDEWTIWDIFAPMVEKSESEAARAKWMTVPAVMLLGDTQRYVFHHYMHKAAMELEIDLRNRQSAQLGSLHWDVRVPTELDAEIGRRMDAYVERRDADNAEQGCDDLLRILSVYQAMSDSLSCRGVPEYSQMKEACQALFFCMLTMSPELQAMLFQSRHRWRLPQHVPLCGNTAVLEFMAVLKRLTPLYISDAIDAREYVHKLRQYVLVGSLELSDTEGEEEPPPQNDDEDEQNE